MSAAEALYAHLGSGTTTTCRAWDLQTKVGTVLGFTDHDLDLTFDGLVYKAGGGMTARAFEQSSGLAIDNSEALGVLSHDSISEAGIRRGDFDGASIRVWQVNWSNPDERVLHFTGSLGEIERTDGGFRAELLGLSEALNKERGHVFQTACSAVLGDQRCGFLLDQPGYTVSAPIASLAGTHTLKLESIGSFAARWFERGFLRIQSGAAEGFSTLIKNDRTSGTVRTIETWDQLPTDLGGADEVRLQAGCDKLSETCRLKFDNLVNFRGFPTIPGEDWLLTYPKADGKNDGGKL